MSFLECRMIANEIFLDKIFVTAGDFVSDQSLSAVDSPPLFSRNIFHWFPKPLRGEGGGRGLSERLTSLVQMSIFSLSNTFPRLPAPTNPLSIFYPSPFSASSKNTRGTSKQDQDVVFIECYHINLLSMVYDLLASGYYQILPGTDVYNTVFQEDNIRYCMQKLYLENLIFFKLPLHKASCFRNWIYFYRL